MERLHQMMRVILLFLILGGLRTAMAAPYCSLVVRVLSPDQRRPLEVPISVREGNGRILEKETTSEDVKFCDLGITPVTVTVGGDSCNQTVVKDVPLSWNELYLLTITYDPEPCMPERPPAPIPTCQELLRVADTDGRWVEKASIRFQDSILSPRETDDAGRALVVLKNGERIQGIVISPGYVTKPFSLTCSRTQPVHEEMIKLTRSPGR